MTVWNLAQIAAPSVWSGAILAISFIEAPLKFRAPGITVELGVGIGRLVFRALNALELVLAITVAIALLAGGDDSAVIWATLAAAIGALGGKVGLRRRMDRLARRDLVKQPRASHALHILYGLAEVTTVLLLTALSVLQLQLLMP